MAIERSGIVTKWLVLAEMDIGRSGFGRNVYGPKRLLDGMDETGLDETGLNEMPNERSGCWPKGI